MSDLEVQVISELSNGWYRFLPICGEVQSFLCELLHVPLIIRHVGISPKPLGYPIKLFNNSGDGNCLDRSHIL